jgi:MFS family permease
VFKHRNNPLNIVGMLCWLTCVALFPSYLVDHLHLSLEQMGYILSAIGIGGAMGTLVMPALSDRLDRKPVMIISVVGLFVLSRISLFFIRHRTPTRRTVGCSGREDRRIDWTSLLCELIST